MKDYLIFDESVIQSLQLFPDSQQTISVRDDTATSYQIHQEAFTTS